MAFEITINVDGVKTSDGDTEVRMSGTKPAIMPDIIAKNRLRLRAIRVVGLEDFGRSAGEAILDGDFGRVTEILHYEESSEDGIFSEFNATVAVSRERMR